MKGQQIDQFCFRIKTWC